MIDKLNEILAKLEEIRDRDAEDRRTGQTDNTLPLLAYSELAGVRMQLREIIWSQESEQIKRGI